MIHNLWRGKRLEKVYSLARTARTIHHFPVQGGCSAREGLMDAQNLSQMGSAVLQVEEVAVR